MDATVAGINPFHDDGIDPKTIAKRVITNTNTNKVIIPYVMDE